MVTKTTVPQSVPVRALTTSWTDAVTRDHAFVDALVRGFGGPVHLLDVRRFSANTEAFAAVLDVLGLGGTVYFGKKANKATSFAQAVAALATHARTAGTPHRFGIDVASTAEFVDALAAGVRGEDLLVTGPHKPVALHRMAIHHGAVLTVDSPAELTAAAALSDGARLRILLRAAPAVGNSRFGMTPDELAWSERYLADRGSDLVLLGYGFHLSGYGLGDRTRRASELLDRIAEVRGNGLDARVLSIGGGFPVDYVSRADWQAFTDPAVPHAFHADKSFSDYYPFHSPIAGAEAFRAVLTGTVDGSSVARRCRDLGVSIVAEPGRALLDKAGVSVFPVLGVKDRTPALIVVAGTSLSLSEQWFNTEFVPQPELLSATVGNEPFRASVGAATCLESDMLTWRVLEFPQRPVVGDHLVYHNTAGYQMDSNESEFHGTPVPPKIAVALDGDGRKTWTLDRQGGST